ncbi:MAG: hypothetical protein ABSE73_06540 [Planctomycetota bacterium]
MLRVWAYFLPLLLAELVAVYAAWESFRERGGRIAYGITDFWALMAGLTPSFLLAAHTVREMEFRLYLFWPAKYMFVLLTVLVVSQLAGLAVAMLCCKPAGVRERFGALRSTSVVLAGTVGGFVAVIFYVLALNALGRPL